MTDKADIIEQAREALEGATPGPWDLCREKTESGINWIWVGPTKWFTRVCRVVLYSGEEKQQEANAHLIALSPDLARIAIAADELANASKLYDTVTMEYMMQGGAELAYSHIRAQAKLDSALTAFQAAKEGKR